MGPVHFLNLPVELICRILGLLDTLDLIQCTILTKRLRRIIVESSRLQYTMELAKHRMVSLLPSSSLPPFVSRLRLLREREQAWKYLAWNGRHRLQLPPTGSVYEFVGGLYGNGKEDDRRTTASISFLELPSAGSLRLENGLMKLKAWSHPMSDVTIIDFTMDPSQDLLVLVAIAAAKYVYEIHLRSLSTNEPHPKSSLPVLPCLLKPSHPHQASERIASVRVQVSGDLVALLVKEVHDSAGAHLEIWDWQHNPQFSCKMGRISGIDDFTLLAQDTFLLVRPSGHFEVYTFQNPIKTCCSPICQASYALPPLSDGYMYWYITMSSNPAPGFVPYFNAETHTAPESGKQISYPEPDERIHACCLYIFNPSVDAHDHHVHCFVLFVNINTLLKPPEEWLTRSMRYRPPSSSHVRHARPTVLDLTYESDYESDYGSDYDYESDSESDSTPVTSAIPLSVGIPGPSSHLSSTAPTPQSYGLPYPEYIYALMPSPVSPPADASLSPPPLAPLPPHSLPHSLPHTHISTRPTPTPALSSGNGSSLRTAPIQPPAQIPWAIWGPQNTRWFPEGLTTDWQHSLYGLRTVESVSIEEVKTQFMHRGTNLDSLDTQTDKAREANLMNPGQAAPDDDEANNSPDVKYDDDGEQPEGGGNDEESGPPIPMRYLRVRDFNPYSIMKCIHGENMTDIKGKNKSGWRAPRVVTEASTINVMGIFKFDVTSWLPYVEVFSEEMFEVTDVMMDDCRILLLTREQNGRLRHMDVLTM